MASEIKYKDGAIATVKAGNIATLKCKGKRMTSDLVFRTGDAPKLQEKTATWNGEVTPDEDYDGLSKVTVNVPDSPIPIEVSTEAEMTALLESGEVGGVYKYVGETTDTYENGALFVLESPNTLGAFIDGTATDIVLPTATKVRAEVFYGYTPLVSIEMPKVTSIESKAFYQCTNLISVKMPNVTSIGNQAFAKCSGLTSLTFESTPASIANDAFSDCTNLTTINVPWAEGEVANAPWGATNAQIVYNYTGE